MAHFSPPPGLEAQDKSLKVSLYNPCNASTWERNLMISEVLQQHDIIGLAGTGLRLPKRQVGFAKRDIGYVYVVGGIPLGPRPVGEQVLWRQYFLRKA